MNTINIQRQDRITTITLRRPEVHNAFNGDMIQELTQAFEEAGAAAETRVVILAAEGKTFCAGADLNWMRTVATFSYEENVAEAMALGRMLKSICDCPKPVVGRIQGSAFGGGVGLTAACDLTVALDAAAFSVSEVKLGLIPAVISPFILRKLQPGVAQRYFLTAERMPAAEARRCGLISEVVATPQALDEQVTTWVNLLVANAPDAMAACKRLVDDVTGPAWEELLPIVARYGAERRASSEAQEGMRAFLEKRRPSWIPE